MSVQLYRPPILRSKYLTRSLHFHLLGAMIKVKMVFKRRRTGSARGWQRSAVRTKPLGVGARSSQNKQPLHVMLYEYLACTNELSQYSRR